jgi:hypothetical protein
MTRKDYERIADAMKRAYWQTSSRDSLTGQRTYAAYVQNLAAEFLKDNPRFSKHRFYEACGLLNMGISVSQDTAEV